MFAWQVDMRRWVGFDLGIVDKLAVCVGRRSWWRVKPGRIGLASVESVLHRVVDFEDDALRTIITVMLLLVLTAHDRKCVHDMRYGIARGCEALFQLRQVCSCFAFGRAPVTV